MDLWTPLTAWLDAHLWRDCQWLAPIALASRSSPPAGEASQREPEPNGAVDDEAAPSARRLRTTLDMLQLQQAIIDNLPDAKVVIDDDGRIVLTNRQTELMFGYTRDQMVGEPVETLMPDRFRTQHAQHRIRYNEDPRTRPMGMGGSELWGRHRSGREFRLEIMLAPIIIGAGGFTIAIIRRAPANRVEAGEAG